jgi:hypothetical protein
LDIEHMTLLSRDQILTAHDLDTEDVDCPEWGGTVRIRSLTGEERDRFEASCLIERDGKQSTNLENMRARLVALSVVGEDGKPVFTGADVKRLGMKNAAVLDRVFEAARELSGLTKTDVEELTEGLGDAQSDGSTSD